jgi:hypothetical protein
MMRTQPPKTGRRPFHRAYCAFERVALGTAMTFVAFVLERQLLKAVRNKGEQPAAGSRGGGLSAAPHQVGE